MDARSIIAKIRVRSPLKSEELSWFANGLANGEVSDAQAGAFAMAVCLNGFSEAERVNLTRAMRDSGQVMQWDMPGPVLDKHSTGGVGDTVSLLLAPALAACGAFVPMISGRGLGHTGGTLDKLESIPGLKTEVDEMRLRDMVRDIGCAIVSASGQIAPADKRLYAIRDVTATVESTDLITASILSKKLAAGLDGLILDVKIGSGAFMSTLDEANTLAEALVSTANGAGCPAMALITDMNQPTATALGNALEVIEVMRTLGDSGASPVLTELTIVLGGALLSLGGLAESAGAGEKAIAEALADGRAADIFGRMITALGGPADFTDRWRDRLPCAPVIKDVLPEDAGFVTAIDGRALGMCVVHLGGGRLVGTDRINPSVGLENVARLGEAVDQYTPLARVHAASESDAGAAIQTVRSAFTLGDKPANLPPLIVRRVR